MNSCMKTIDQKAPEKASAICPRCGGPFVPKPTNVKVVPITRFCDDCQVRNLFDGFDLPTPPELLDRHTKHPTLSEREFKARMAESAEES